MNRAENLVTRIHPNENGWMLKQVIYGRLGLSRGLLRRMKAGGAVYLNGEPAYITQRGQSGDTLEIQFADTATNLPDEDVGLDVVYEDSSLVLINKQAGMAVHPTRTYQSGTVANGLAHMWRERGYQRRVRLLHRLDRDTSGLLLVAKDPYAYQRLSQQLQNGCLQRRYLAVVEGPLPQTQGTVDQPIGRHPGSEGHSLRRAVRADGRRAVTHFRLLQHYRDCTLVELNLETGRTHQIRVHMQWLGCPLVGDTMYESSLPGFGRQALHAYRMSFIHPRTQEAVIKTAPMPEDMKRWLMERKKTS